MKRYIGISHINARPMTRQEYNDLRHWKLPENENGDDTGMLVEDINSGHINWFPDEKFESLYSLDGKFAFSKAVELLKAGYRVAREGWNGKGMFLFLVGPSHNLTVNREPLISSLGEGYKFSYQAHVDMFTADGTIVPWLCSQSDMLADDWVIVPDA